VVVPWFIQRLLAITWWFLLGITLIRPSLTGLLSDPGRAPSALLLDLSFGQDSTVENV